MKKLLIGLIALLLAGLAVPSAFAQGSGLWTAEYFNNASLSGGPIIVRNESTPTNEWGWGAPAAGIPADYFSVRWSKTDYVDAGTYQFSIRADDGVRMYIDGVLHINEWHPAAGTFYQATVSLGAGNHSFVVEYFEATEVAFLIYNVNVLGGGPAPGTPQATVTANFLNLRSAPTPASSILTVLSRGQTYQMIGRNAFNTWVQLNVGGTIGWVNVNYVSTTNIFAVPITDGGGGTIPTPTPIPPPPPPSGATATVTAYLLNVRNAPNPFTGGVVTQIRRNEVYAVIGRNLDTSWVQINVGGLTGWVRATWTALNNIGGVPVTSNTTNPSDPAPPPVTSYATVRAYFLHLRSAAYYPAPILTVLSLGQTYPAVGRNADSSWVQVNVGGTYGWLRSTWVTVTPNLYSLPVTG
jgi:uncharacterized protein YraI